MLGGFWLLTMPDLADPDIEICAFRKLRRSFKTRTYAHCPSRPHALWCLPKRARRESDMGILWAVLLLLRGTWTNRVVLLAENLALRQQLIVLQRSIKRPRLRQSDRIFWIWLTRLWPGWRSVLVIVQPDTVVRWHQQGFRLYWRWKSSNRLGRPAVGRQILDLIRRMARENPAFTGRVKHMGIEQVLITPRSPWQNPYAERVIGSTRRECLDHVIVLNEDHLHRILTEYFAYYHNARAHLSLERNSPNPRAVETATGKIASKLYLGGLHHLYTRAA